MRSPIIVLGAPRSGTTLLAGIAVAAHPDDAVLAGSPALVWRYGNDRRSDELRPEHASNRGCRAHPPRLRIRAEAEPGQPGWWRSRPATPSGPAFVDAVFPDALFVHIVRDGWSAVPSIYRFWGRRGSGIDAKQGRKLVRRFREAAPSQIPHYLLELSARSLPHGLRREPLYGPRLAGLRSQVDDLGRLEASAAQWRSCVEQMSVFGRSLGPGRYVEVRLEELDRRIVKDLLSFCGLSESEEVLELFDATYKSERASSRTHLTLDQARRVAPYVMPANAWLGYPEVSPEEVADSAAGPRDRVAGETGPAPAAIRLGYIVGAKNCGSTMLEALIGQAPGVRTLGELGGFARYTCGGSCECGAGAGSCVPCRAIIEALQAENELGLLQNIYQRPLGERGLHWTLVPTRGRRSYAALSDRMLASVSAATGCHVLVDSSKNIGRAAALAFDGTNDTKVIHLVRDGRGFLASRKKRAEKDGSAYRPAAALAEWAGKNLAISLLLRPRLGAGRYLLCRYEELLSDPRAELNRIGSFLGVDLSGVAERALTTGVSRQHLYEPPRRYSYGTVTLDPSRLESQRWPASRNRLYWILGGCVSAIWRYDRTQSYLPSGSS